MNAHAQVAAELLTGSMRAIMDFEDGNESIGNPFSKSGQYWSWTAYNRKMDLLICRRDHDNTICCQEHKKHIITGSSKSYMGYISCTACEKEIDKLREIRQLSLEKEKNESI